jgi:UDP-N-acetylglucosamine 2-epimerase (non-hydrolysing)
VLTDPGGIQEETTYLGVPCLTARPNTERPVTITQGTNRLAASRATDLMAAAQGTLATTVLTISQPDLWDGCAATRITAIFREELDRQAGVCLANDRRAEARDEFLTLLPPESQLENQTHRLD